MRPPRRQLVQQYAKNLEGVTVDPKIASAEAKAVFRSAPVSASLCCPGRLSGSPTYIITESDLD